jgi:hypothetical protein
MAFVLCHFWRSSFSPEPHRAVDLGARQADVLEHPIAHEHQLPGVAPDADFVRNGAPRRPSPNREVPEQQSSVRK